MFQTTSGRASSIYFRLSLICHSIFQLVGLLILILACVAIPKVQQVTVKHMIIVIIVFTLFMAALGGLLHFASAQSSADEYDVEKETKGKE